MEKEGWKNQWSFCMEVGGVVQIAATGALVVAAPAETIELLAQPSPVAFVPEHHGSYAVSCDGAEAPPWLPFFTLRAASMSAGVGTEAGLLGC